MKMAAELAGIAMNDSLPVKMEAMDVTPIVVKTEAVTLVNITTLFQHAFR